MHFFIHNYGFIIHKNALISCVVHNYGLKNFTQIFAFILYYVVHEVLQNLVQFCVIHYHKEENSMNNKVSPHLVLGPFVLHNQSYSRTVVIKLEYLLKNLWYIHQDTSRQ